MIVFWGYAIADRAPATPPIAGMICVDGEGVVLCGAELASPPPIELDALASHDRVVRAIAEQVGSVLPLRFGVRAESGAAMWATLRAHRALLARGLEEVRGALQITLRIQGAPQEGPVSAPRDEGGPGARYLRARARALAPVIPGWAELVTALRPHLRAERVTERYRVYHLVPRPSLAAYQRELAVLVARAPWAIRCGDPAPPYAFVPEELV